MSLVWQDKDIFVESKTSLEHTHTKRKRWGEVKYDIPEPTYDITQDIAIRVAKGFDSAIFMTIQQIAKEN
jgi:hypothetical protein